MSYHNGSVWPHDNALIAAGFARYGFRREAAKVFDGVFAAATYIDLRRLPELFCGLARQRAQGPTFYPVACMPQAWAAAAPLSLIQSCIGLTFEPEERRKTVLIRAWNSKRETATAHFASCLNLETGNLKLETALMRIVSIGEVLWDVIGGSEYLGGAPLNFAAHAHKLGHEVYLLSAVGEDERGKRALLASIG